VGSESHITYIWANFNSVRLGLGVDGCLTAVVYLDSAERTSVITSAKSGDTGDFGTVVFIRKGRVWRVDASVDGRLLSTAELEK